MPRYQRGRDWVEIAGAASRSMGELRVIWQADEAAARGLLDELVVRGQFVDRHGVAWEFTPTLPAPAAAGAGTPTPDPSPAAAGAGTTPLSSSAAAGAGTTPPSPPPLRQGGRPWDHLTLQQYDWLRDRVYQAARDEALDPEG